MMRNRFDFTFPCLLALVFTVVLAGHASAQRYWSGAGFNPATAGAGTWNDVNQQWSSTFPGYTAAVWDSNIANFNGTGGGTVTLDGDLAVKDINFGANAGAFTLNNGVLGQILTINGAGITNNSANTQTITNSGTVTQTEFSNSATAGNATINNSGDGTVTSFSGSSTAANATINSSGINSLTLFSNSSTAANATITNSNPGAHTIFKDSSTAGSATINNSGTQTDTIFNAGTTASNATINNSGAFSRTEFDNGATAGNATITNSNNTASTIRFNGGNASAGNAIINNNGTGLNSFVEFNVATAGNATINNNGAGARVQFEATSTAASATITNSGAGSQLDFTDSSSGGTATLVNANATAEIDLSFLSTPGMTAGAIAGNGFINLGSKNLTVGGNNTSTVFSGVIRDGGHAGGTGGSLTKEGTGNLTLTGHSIYTGDTNISGGTLFVDGEIDSNTFVLPGGTLGGTGDISAAVSNNGVVSPGHNSTGLLQILLGNYTQLAGGTLRMEIGGTAIGTYDFLGVGGGGQAFLAGTLSLARVNNYNPMVGDQVLIIATTLGVHNRFDNVVNDFLTLVQPRVIYEADDVRIVFVQGSFQLSGLTPNQKAVARNLNDSVGDPAATTLINFLDTELLPALPHDYDLIAPEELAAIYEISISSSMIQNNNLQRRMDDIRAGSNGFCANGFTPQVSGKDVSKDSGGKVVLDQKQGPDVYVPTENNRWGVFINGTGDFVNVGDRDSNAPGYDITTGEFTLGVDYRVGDHFAIGIDGGYSSSRAELVNNGRIDTDGGKIGAYATMFGKGLFGSKFYVDATVGGGLNNYDTRRTGLQNEFVRGDTDGTEFNAMISYGSDWTFGCFNIGTWSSVQFTNVNIDEFTETGSLAPLIIEDQDENSFRTTTGVHASYDIKAGHVLIRPEVRAAYQHEYCDSAYQVDSQLASGAGGIFRVRGPRIGRDSALVDAGVNVQWNNRLATYVYYDGVLGRNNYDNNAVSGGFRIGF